VDNAVQTINRMIPVEYDGYRLLVTPDALSARFLSICCRAATGDGADWRLVSVPGHATTVCFSFGNRRYFHKTFHARNYLEPVKTLFRGTRAARSLAGHLLLSENGFLTPKVVAVGQKGRRNFMVSAGVPNSVSLNAFLHAGHGKKALIRQLGELVGRMHALNIVHGDLLCGNILLSDADDGAKRGQFDIWFIDNERTKRHPVLFAKLRIKNLVQLNKAGKEAATKTDRLLFFNRYLCADRRVAQAKKKWVGKTVKRTARRLEKRAKHGGGGGE